MFNKNKKSKRKNENLFVRILDKILKLSYLKMFELSIGFVKGFAIKVEFFESKVKVENK